MTVTDTDDEPAEPIEVRDELGLAISAIIAYIFESLPHDCPARRLALTATIETHTRIAALLRGGGPRMH
jgi:hypothetical protein